MNSLQRLLGTAKAPPAWLALAGCFTLLAVIGLLDYVSGSELAFSIFYLLPVLLTTWYVGFRAGIVMALLAGLTWGAMDFAGGVRYSSPLIPLWNTVMRMGFFALTLYLLDRLRRSSEHERELARTDPLTGLGNTRAFESRAGLEIERSKRNGTTLTLGYLDLDEFKQVNDRFGHSAGDELLVRIADILAAGTRATDYAARLGGDEFAVLMPDTDANQARQVLVRLGALLAQVQGPDGRGIGWTVGAACFLQAPESVDEMIRAGDRLMYDGKHAGRGRLVVSVIGPDAGGTETFQQSFG